MYIYMYLYIYIYIFIYIYTSVFIVENQSFCSVIPKWPLGESLRKKAYGNPWEMIRFWMF